jgi:hypothetical protein
MQHKPPRLANRIAAIFNPTLPYLGCTGLHDGRTTICRGHADFHGVTAASSVYASNFQVGFHPAAGPRTVCSCGALGVRHPHNRTRF